MDELFQPIHCSLNELYDLNCKDWPSFPKFSIMRMMVRHYYNFLQVNEWRKEVFDLDCSALLDAWKSALGVVAEKADEINWSLKWKSPVYQNSSFNISDWKE